MQNQQTTPHKAHANLICVAIVGRTNVGKSSLFNRIAGKKLSIVQPDHGTTLDRISTVIHWKKAPFLLIDTAGFSFEKKVPFREEINREVDKAIQNANLLLFVCDGREGVHPQDELFAQKLRDRKKQVILVVNKIDQPELYGDADQFYQLGYEQLVKVSAAHGGGIAELLDTVTRKLPESKHLKQPDYSMSLCIVGEPNSGKSTYFNSLLDEERAIVSEIPGTTRDVISEIIEYKGKKILLNDTAGFRSTQSYEEAIHCFSIVKTKHAIRASEVVLLLCDGYRGFSRTSKQIANFIFESQKPCVIAVNKWDLVKRIEQAHYHDRLKRFAPFLATCPFVFLSAKLRKNILAPLDAVFDVYESFKRHVKTNELNELLMKIKKSGIVRNPAKLKYLTQIGTAPPRFLLFGRNMDRLKMPDLQFIKNRIQAVFHFEGIPIQLSLREDRE